MDRNNGNNGADLATQVSVVDWTRQKRVRLNGQVQADTRVGEISSLAVHALGLPNDVPYSAFVTSDNGQRHQKLNKADTISELGLGNEVELMVAPEVSAG